MMTHSYTVDEIARSMVTSALKKAEKELDLKEIVAKAQAVLASGLVSGQVEQACDATRITQACKTLAEWNKIVEVSPGCYCHPAHAPKYRTIDDTWVS